MQILMRQGIQRQILSRWDILNRDRAIKESRRHLLGLLSSPVGIQYQIQIAVQTGLLNSGEIQGKQPQLGVHGEWMFPAEVTPLGNTSSIRLHAFTKEGSSWAFGICCGLGFSIALNNIKFKALVYRFCSSSSSSSSIIIIIINK